MLRKRHPEKSCSRIEKVGQNIRRDRVRIGVGASARGGTAASYVHECTDARQTGEQLPHPPLPGELMHRDQKPLRLSGASQQVLGFRSRGSQRFLRQDVTSCRQRGSNRRPMGC